MTPAEVLARHVPYGEGMVCSRCEQDPPCDAVEMARQLQAAQSEPRAWLADQPQYNREMRNSTTARQQWQRQHDAWLQHGPSVARAALAEPKP